MSKSLLMKINILLLVTLTFSLFSVYLKFFPSGYEMWLLIAVDFIATVPVVISAANSLINKKVTVDLLASVALFVSLIHREWASVAFINLMITSARIFGDYTQNRADAAIKSLLKLRPEKVKIKKGSQIYTIDIGKVRVGDIVLIEAGDRVPVDGIIIQGDGSFDQSSLTGESLPVTRIKGQKVFSSTLNLSGSLLVKTEKVGKDTTFEKIIALVQNAQLEKQGIQGIADKFATIYIIITLSGTIILYAITQNLSLILSILLVACADDIAVAIPMAFWGAIAMAGKQGIIIKGGNFLEGLSQVETIIFDKTGTLTKGVVRAEKIICFKGFKSEKALSLISGVESVSEHPIAKAITAHGVNDGIKFKTPDKFEEISGYGIKAYYKKTKVVAGNLKLLKKEEVKIEKEEIKVAESYQKQGYQVVFLGVEEKLVSLVVLADQIRPEARQTISELKSFGIKNIIMLTGDNELVAARIAREIGINEFHASLLPADKLNFIKAQIEKSKGKVVMVGDGVNDAAALKLADIGIAMGAIGADSAIESADIALMHDNLLKLISAIKLSRRTRKISKENFFIWGGVNSIGLALVFSFIIGPEGAAAWNFITDFFPILNALRVFRYKFN